MLFLASVFVRTVSVVSGASISVFAISTVAAAVIPAIVGFGRYRAIGVDELESNAALG